MPNVDWTNKNTLQNLINTIHARLITKIAHYAVMPTANNKLLGEIAQYIGTTDANFVNAYFYKCYEVVDEDTGAVSYSWKPVDVQASTAISAENDNALVELSDGFYVKAVQMTALPVATADNLGVIYQYVGTTNVSFINGYFYKNEAVTDETTGDVTYEWHNVKTQDATAISEVVDNAIVDLADGIYVKAVQLVTLPEATVDNVGVIYQYIGNSTATLTNGYFYKNIATTDEDTGETTYAWTAFATQEEAVKHWIGTRAELEVALENDEIEDGTVILITDEPEIDELPTEDSTNLVYSGGVWTALQEKENVFRYTTMPTAGEELEGEIVEYIGATTLDYTNGYFYKCVSDGGDPAVYSWENIPVQDMGEKIQYEVLPTPTADNLGQIAEYIGTTNAEYTNGFFYEVAEVAESDPAEYEWVQKNVQPEGLKASGHPVNNTSDRPDWHSGIAGENWEGYFSKPTVDVVAISESEVGEYDTGYVYVVEDPTLSTHSTLVWEIVYISNGDTRKYYKSTNLVTVNKVSITQELYNAIPAANLDVDWTWWVTDTNTVYYRGKTFSGLRASGYPINNIEDKPDWHSGIAEESWEGYYSKPTIDATAVLSTELDSHKGEYVYVVKEPTDTDLPTLWWEIVYISGNESYQPGNKYKCTSLAKVNKVSITKELYDMIPGEKLDVDWTWWITDKSTIMLDGVEYGGDTIQVVSLPTATADNLGKIVQYIGENDTVNNLVKGFFYRCTEVPDTDPTDYEWVHQNVDEISGDAVVWVTDFPTAPDIKNVVYGKITTTTEYTDEKTVSLDSLDTETRITLDGDSYIPASTDNVYVKGGDVSDYEVFVSFNTVTSELTTSERTYTLETETELTFATQTTTETKSFRIGNEERQELTELESGGTEVIANPSETATETLSKVSIDGTVYEVGGDTIQVETLPTASASEVGNIYQYIGATTTTLTNGYFYECVEDSGSYVWVEKEVQKNDDVPHWSGTRAEYEAIKDTLEAGTYVSITDDYDEGLEVVDVIEDGNMNPVTSNAVAGLFGKVNTISVTMRPDAVPGAAKTLSSNMFIPTSADGKRGLLIGRAATEPFTAPTSITNFDISSPAIALWHNWVISSAYEYSNANARLCYVDTNVPGFYMDGLTTTGNTLKAVQFIADVTLA